MAPRWPHVKRVGAILEGVFLGGGAKGAHARAVRSGPPERTLAPFTSVPSILRRLQAALRWNGMRRNSAFHRPSSTTPPVDVICSHARISAYQVPAGASYENPRWRVPFAKRPGYGLFAFALATLREQLPTPIPTIVRTGNLPPEIDGYCVRRPSRFVIQIDRKLTCEAAIGVLLHEWAHARAWNHRLDGASKGGLSRGEFEAVCHGPEFGCAYAEAWRLLATRIIPAWRIQRDSRTGSASSHGGGANSAAERGTESQR